MFYFYFFILYLNNLMIFLFKCIFILWIFLFIIFQQVLKLQFTFLYVNLILQRILYTNRHRLSKYSLTKFKKYLNISQWIKSHCRQLLYLFMTYDIHFNLKFRVTSFNIRYKKVQCLFIKRHRCSSHNPEYVLYFIWSLINDIIF